jgi:hypothetical protein
MGLPTPSPAQTAALTALKDVALAGASATAGKVAAIQGALDKQQDVEDFQKETFDTINDNIIGKYENERRWIDGQDIASKIVETDVQKFANGDDSSRLWNGGDFSPTRIAQFDGGPLVALEQLNEIDLFTSQDTILQLLQSGYPGQTTISNGAEIFAEIDGNSNSVRIINNLEDIDINDVLFVSGGGNIGLLKVLSVTGYCTGETPAESGVDEPTCTANGGTWTENGDITFEYIITPAGTIPANSSIGQKTFGGFTDTERTNQIASDSDFQGIMNLFLGQLEDVFNNRIAALNNQISAIDSNEDDNIDLTAKTNCQTSIAAITALLGVTPPGTIDISDTGISDIDDEKDIRRPQALQRIADIAAAIAFGASGALSYYDQRFNTTEGRCRLNNGSIVLLNDLTKAKSDVQAGGAEATALASRYDNLLT